VIVAATASAGPGAGCHCGTSGIKIVEYPLSATPRSWSRQVGRSVVIGATTPNRNGLAPLTDVPVMPMTLPSVGPLPNSPPLHERAPPDPTEHDKHPGGAFYEGHQATKTHLGQP
jgi:hypothetical protein